MIPCVFLPLLAKDYESYLIYVKKTYAPLPPFGPHKNLLNSNLVSKLVSTPAEWIVLSFSKFSVIKLFEIVILWVYYTIPFGFSLFWYVWDISFQLLKLLLWLRTTEEGSVPEMRIWSILLFESDLKWCIHLSRSLFLYFNYLVSVTAGGPVSPRGHM